MKTFIMMKRWARARLGSRVMGIGLVALATGLLGSPQALAQVKDTKHNLGSTNSIAGANKYTSTNGDSTQVCVFCHTPHGSNTTAQLPLWNRALGTATYTTYASLGTTTLEGKTAAVGSVSLACLSCHDGTQAINVMNNTPGSGNAALTGSWSAGTGSLDIDGKFKAGVIANIGGDLQNDHPIGIQYAGGPKTGSVPAAGQPYTNTMFNDEAFADASSAELNSNPVWWVDTSTGSPGSREKTDMQLYARTDASSGGSTLTGVQPFVECASCHDPHTNKALFLRIENTGSAVCLACHIK